MRAQRPLQEGHAIRRSFPKIELPGRPFAVTSSPRRPMLERPTMSPPAVACSTQRRDRSEERRVGKECRSRWSRDHHNKKIEHRAERPRHKEVKSDYANPALTLHAATSLR